MREDAKKHRLFTGKNEKGAVRKREYFPLRFSFFQKESFHFLKSVSECAGVLFYREVKARESEDKVFLLYFL